MSVLRDYQRRAIDETWAWIEKNEGNPCLVMPTASGKSHVIAAMCKEAVTSWPETTILMLTHVKELIEQNAEKMRQHWPAAPMGIYSAGMRRRDLGEPITFAGIQSIRTRAADVGHVDLCIIDECHLVSHKDEGTYRAFLNELLAVNSQMRVVGLTATPYRLGHGYITDKPALFDALIEPVSIEELLYKGHLSPLPCKATRKKYDTVGLHTKGGEFIESELQKLVDTDEQNAVVADEIIANAAGRKSWLLFCTGVEHARHMAAALAARGIVSACVTGETPKGERESMLKDFKVGKIQAMTNANVLTTGFDAPGIDLIAFCRPTLSVSLYMQMAGRGLRVAPGKADCIAEGTLVLTDCGEVPIELVTTAHRVWDGTCFVSHDGPILRGEREVITYAGLTATPDHLVWTKEGWMPFGQCAREQISIAATGDGGRPIREADGYFSSRDKERETQAHLPKHSMRLRPGETNKPVKSSSADCGVPPMWVPSCRPEVARNEMHCGQTAMHESERQEIPRLRRQRYSVSLRRPNGNGGMDPRESRRGSFASVGPDKQRRALRAGKPASFDCSSESGAHKEAEAVFRCASVPPNAPGGALCRCDTQSLGCSDDVRRNRREIQSEVVQTKRRVWDILNAGPLHRFTASGLLVHNCLVLDFAGLVSQHGVITNPRIKRGKGEGDAPVKVCDECSELCHISAKECPACGWLFPIRKEDAPPVKPELAEVDMVFGINPDDVRHMNVTDWKWQLATSKKSGKEMIVCTYYGALSDKPVKEYFTVFHDGYAGEKAWRKLIAIATKLASWMPAEVFAKSDAAGIIDAMNAAPHPAEVHFTEEGKFMTVTKRVWP